MAQRGRPTNEERARRATEAAEIASRAAQSVQTPEPSPETDLPVETNTPPERQEPEEKSELTYRAPRNETRRQAMEEIEQRDLQSKSETGLRGQLGLTDEEPKGKEETPQDPPPPTAESMLQGGKFSQPQETQTVRVKIDGEEFDAPKEDVEAYGGVKSYQIAKAAENRLAEAKATLAEAKKFQEQKTPVQTPNDWMKERVEKLRWGTPEESAQALNEILEKNNKPVDRNEIVQAATDQMRHDAAVSQFDKEFTDIGASMLHLKLVAALRNERLQKGHPGDWNTFYRSIGNEVRAIMPKQNQPGVTPKGTDTTSQFSEKEERKSSIVTLPQASQRASLPEEPKVESREELLNNMRKKRGFQPHT